jgi:hypothetical protein
MEAKELSQIQVGSIVTIVHFDFETKKQKPLYEVYILPEEIGSTRKNLVSVLYIKNFSKDKHFKKFSIAYLSSGLTAINERKPGFWEKLFIPI